MRAGVMGDNMAQGGFTGSRGRKNKGVQAICSMMRRRENFSPPPGAPDLQSRQCTGTYGKMVLTHLQCGPGDMKTNHGCTSFCSANNHYRLLIPPEAINMYLRIISTKDGSYDFCGISGVQFRKYSV